jgi:D-alanyl-lipoteichoic acid acyltransferase DltB (MBOAT superfamily)
VASSFLFCGWADYRFAILLFISVLADYFISILMDKQKRQGKRNGLLICSLFINFFVLGVFKYLNFFIDSFTHVLSSLGWHWNCQSLNIILPLGISFYTFQKISYIVDVYKNKLPPEKDIWVFAAFVSFFPKFVAGPIERAEHLMPQLRCRKNPDGKQIAEGLWLILWGFFLKVYMADNIGPVVDEIYKNYQTVSGIDVMICHYAYAFQIFGDFAGYSFIAMGTAQLLGIRLVNNFLFPYFIKTTSEFWRHWHISLSAWLRDYLFIPLGGSRCNRILIYRNLLITMILAGLWHGAAWHFVLWGLYQGIMLVLFRIFTRRSSTNVAKFMTIKSLFAIFIMFNITTLGWMIFRTPNTEVMFTMINHILFNFGHISYKTCYWAGITIVYVSVPLVIHCLQFQRNDAKSIPFETPLSRVLCCILIIFLLLGMGNWETKSFLYSQF